MSNPYPPRHDKEAILQGHFWVQVDVEMNPEKCPDRKLRQLLLANPPTDTFH